MVLNVLFVNLEILLGLLSALFTTILSHVIAKKSGRHFLFIPLKAQTGAV